MRKGLGEKGNLNPIHRRTFCDTVWERGAAPWRQWLECMSTKPICLHHQRVAPSCHLHYCMPALCGWNWLLQPEKTLTYRDTGASRQLLQEKWEPQQGVPELGCRSRQSKLRLSAQRRDTKGQRGSIMFSKIMHIVIQELELKAQTT